MAMAMGVESTAWNLAAKVSHSAADGEPLVNLSGPKDSVKSWTRGKIWRAALHDRTSDFPRGSVL